MPIAGSECLTLHDWGKRLGPDNQQADLVEVLTQQNPVLQDAMLLEANNITSHRTSIRAGLPEAYWRLINRGVPKSKSAVTAVDDAIGILEANSEVDRDLAELNGMRASFMLSEAKAFLEAMNQRMAETLFYGNLKSNKAAFTGLGVRYSTLDPAKAASAENVIDAGGTGNDLTSAWIMLWGDQTNHLVNPKGLPTGLQQTTLPGVQRILDADGHPFYGYVTNYSWKLGLVTRDWRYAARIANIPTTNLNSIVETGGATAAAQKLVRQMIVAFNKIPNVRLGRAVWYMNRTVKTMLDLLAAEKSNVNLTMGNFEGEEVTKFKGVPIRQCDAIIDTEDRVTA
ncbi:MAG: hypothetical protein LBU23_08895 [Planctomycetota bacterium]|jgi:hypothetical protein|nr:hypothetical protein [Planctomycetota bacterium]